MKNIKSTMAVINSYVWNVLHPEEYAEMMRVMAQEAWEQAEDARLSLQET